MRINHNIAALNTYRQLSSNQINGSKSLEKLSSGLRINRAGDDAAGLAISEKMRGQIRGLDQASRNAQDGISMIQTAEGALSETHSILQRMRELTTQAANDTNVTQDRGEIQKEINQLTSEINRISNTTEFNTQKLLNGGNGTSRTGSISVMTTQYANNGIVYSGTDTLDMAGTTTATGSVSKLVTTANSVKAGSVTLAVATVDTNSTTLAKAGVVGSPATEITASLQGGTAAIQGNAGLVVVKGAAAVAADAYAAGNFTLTQAKGSAANLQITIDMDTLLKDGINDGATITFGDQAFTAKASGAGTNEFNIGHTKQETIANLAKALNDSAAIVDEDGNNVTVTATGTNILFSADANNKDLNWGTTTGITDVATAKAALEASSRTAQYTFEVKSNFSVDDKIVIGGTTYTASSAATNAAANTFQVKGTIAETVDELFAAMAGDHGTNVLSQEAPAWLWSDDTTSITISAAAGGVDANEAKYSTGLVVNQSTSAKGQYKFELESNFEAGATIEIDGQKFTARDSSGANDGTGFKVGADINATIGNLITAMKANTVLNNKYEINTLSAGAGSFVGTGNAIDLDTVLLEEKAASGQATIAVTSADRAAVAGKFSFEVSKNFSTGDFIEIDGEKFTAVASTATPSGNEFKIVDGDIEGTVANLVAKITANSTKYTAAAADTTFFDGNKVVLTEKAASGTNLSTTIETGSGSSTGKIKQGNIGNVLGKYEFLVTDNFAAGDVIKIDGKLLLAGGAAASAGLNGNFAVGSDANATATNIANAINNATTGSAQELLDLKAKYTVSASGNKITLTEKTASGTDLVDNATNLSVGTNADGRSSSTVEIKEAYEFTAVALEANSVVNIDGTDITLKNSGTAGMVANELKSQIEDSANTATAALRGAYDVTVSGDKITLTQKSAAAQTDITAQFSTIDHNGFASKLQIGANTGQSVTVDVNDMRARALKITGIEGGAKVTASNGAEAYLVATKSATDGTNDEATEYTLDVSTFEKATAAIGVLDDAIKSVSAERSKLGAFQNRLEHTINNLGASSENLTASESRIRDVDMAKEMMEFTKNNILSQAAQAMMAQANQQPQGVLQLLR